MTYLAGCPWEMQMITSHLISLVAGSAHEYVERKTRSYSLLWGIIRPPYDDSTPTAPDAPSASVVTINYAAETITYDGKYEVSATNFGSVIPSGRFDILARGQHQRLNICARKAGRQHACQRRDGDQVEKPPGYADAHGLH